MVDRKKDLSRGLSWPSAIAGFIIGGFFGHFGDAFASWGWEKLWSPTPSIKFDFQAQHGCPNGKLTDLRRFFEDDRIPLVNGADQLIICDSEAMITYRPQAPYDLASKYPGCLSWMAGELIMLRKTVAVCALPGGAGYICDGVNARVHPGAVAMGNGETVAPCATERLHQFGFVSF